MSDTTLDAWLAQANQGLLDEAGDDQEVEEMLAVTKQAAQRHSDHSGVWPLR